VSRDGFARYRNDIARYRVDSRKCAPNDTSERAHVRWCGTLGVTFGHTSERHIARNVFEDNNFEWLRKHTLRCHRQGSIFWTRCEIPHNRCHCQKSLSSTTVLPVDAQGIELVAVLARQAECLSSNRPPPLNSANPRRVGCVTLSGMGVVGGTPGSARQTQLWKGPALLSLGGRKVSSSPASMRPNSSQGDLLPSLRQTSHKLPIKNRVPKTNNFRTDGHTPTTHGRWHPRKRAQGKPWARP
jgi:hypothetical protein